MAFLTIPIDVIQPNHEFSISLDGVIFVMNFKYNFRSDQWSLMLKKEDGTVLVSAVPLVTGSSLLGRYPNDDMPAGDLFVSDDTGNNAEPTKLSFANTHSLIYREVGTV